MEKIYLVSLITFKNCLRQKALYGILLMALVLFGFNIIFTGMFSWDVTKAAVDMGLSTISFSGLILIFFFSINMMSDDMEKKTIYLILSRPISKTQYVIGKYTGLCMVILISSIILGLCSSLSVWISTIFMGYDKALPFTWSFFFVSVCLQTVALLVMMALALLWVMVTSHQFTAVLLTLMTYFVGQNMENVKNIVLSRRTLDPDAFSVQIMDLASWIFPNLSAFNIKSSIAHGLDLNISLIVFTLIYGFAYIGLCICLSIWFFKRKEL